jgi:transcriptional regulator with XRE-family HTH domain
MSPSPRSSVVLPSTLALRVQALREALDLTPRQVAQRAILPLSLIEDIEQGLELFLAPAVRGKLARVLRVKPLTLEEVELRPTTPSIKPVGQSSTVQLIEHWLNTPNHAHPCPDCGQPLVLQVFARRDLHDNPLHAIKAHCTQCLFRVSHG